MEKEAVVLLSGGLDSTTVLAVAKDRGFECNALSFNYGQRHSCELDAAKRVASSMSVKRHVIVNVNFRDFITSSALTSDIEVPKERDEKTMSQDIPVTYVPARNTIFLSFALGWAEVLGVNDIFIGVNALDYSGYPDCRPEYIKAFKKMANLATKAGVSGSKIKIHTPLIKLSKREIIELGKDLGIDYSITHSCYDPINGLACGKCDSCLLRKKGFNEANIPDSTKYASK